MRAGRLVPALLALAALWLAMLLFGTDDTDRALLDLLYLGGRPALVAAARALTELGGFAVLLPATLAVALAVGVRRGDWRGAGWLVAMTLGGRLLVELQKLAILRPRPELEPLASFTSYAFPSGHAANAAMVWLGAAILLGRGRARPWALAAAALVALAVGVTRPMLGVHWPSDVVAGWTFGLFWILLLVRFSGTPPKDCSPASA